MHTLAKDSTPQIFRGQETHEFVAPFVGCSHVFTVAGFFYSFYVVFISLQRLILHCSEAPELVNITA